MAYYDVKPLGDLIREFFELHKGSSYFEEQRAIQCWPQVVGPFIASHTIDLSIKNNVLFVRVDSDALRSELGYSKSLLLNNLNNVIGKTMLTDIVLC
jgi:predicted nucleic acid-binding Zn ribbon protein